MSHRKNEQAETSLTIKQKLKLANKRLDVVRRAVSHHTTERELDRMLKAGKTDKK